MIDLLSYREVKTSKQWLEKLISLLEEQQQKLGRKLRFMEVCGTHTVAISKTGIREQLSPYVDLLSGPGCPVCVTDQSDIDNMISIGQEKDIIITTFGDMMKVPGSSSTLYEQRANGADIRVVYSPTESIQIAKQNPHKMVVFLGVGFETTTPSIALSVQQAEREQVHNYAVYTANKLTPPAVEALIEDENHQLDGFLLPGNVSVIVGRRGWTVLEKYNIPAVIGGFEPLDILSSLYFLILEMEKGERKIVNNYKRVVKEHGNTKAQELLATIFSVNSTKWRGLGRLADSGLQLSSLYTNFDAQQKLKLKYQETKTIKGCQCGQIIKGNFTPYDCKLFGRACTPEKPIGPCMVSSEGACSTYYNYDRQLMKRR